MIKNKSLAEIIGAIIIIVCAIILVIQFSMEGNPFPFTRESIVFFNCVGLIILVVGQKKREKREKSVSEM